MINPRNPQPIHRQEGYIDTPDYLAEALQILSGEKSIQPNKHHLQALYDVWQFNRNVIANHIQNLTDLAPVKLREKRDNTT